MNRIRQFFSSSIVKLGIAGELLIFFGKNKRWWLLPIILIILILSVLLIFGQSTGVAPFIYTLF